MEEDGLLKIVNSSKVEWMEFGDGSLEDWTRLNRRH